jgi:rubrerythrin
MATNTELTAEEQAALAEALSDEHRALAIYDQVLQDFGPVRPFVNIREAEARHAEALKALCVRYGIARVDDAWRGPVPRFAAVQDACRAAVQAEIDNLAMYERLLAVSQHPDLRQVFLALQSASRDHHLPAFRRCVERRQAGGGSDGGPGLRRRLRGVR